MNGEPRRIALWRAAFCRWGDRAWPIGDCPSPEEIWQALHGELPEIERMAVIDHTIACGRCTRDWRLARELAHPLDVGTSFLQAPAYDHRPLGALAAALLVCATLIGGQLNLFSTAPVEYRGGAETDTAMGLNKSTSRRPATDFRLSWQPVDDVLYYELKLATAELTPIYRVGYVTGTEYLIPAFVFLDFAPGTEFTWQVIAVGATGERVVSPVESVRLD